MKRRIKSAIIAAVVTMAMAVTGCGGAAGGGASGGSASSGSEAKTESAPAAETKSDAASGEEVVMKISNQWADSSVHSRMFLEVFIPRVEELSEGRIKCEWYGNNALGNEMDQLSQIQMGTLHMGVFSDQSSSLDPGHMLLPYLPFLFEDEAHWDKVFGGELGQEIVANLPAQGLRVLGFTENGYRKVTNNVRPIETADDMKGLKMRVTNSDMYIAMFTAMGTSCQAMTLGEAYSALETGACDGQDNAFNTILNAGFAEVQKYVANTNHVLGTLYVGVSESWYQGLSDDLKEAVDQACKEACEWQVKTYRELEVSDRQALLDAGMEESNPDIESFKAVTAGVYDDFTAKYPDVADLVARVQAAAN